MSDLPCTSSSISDLSSRAEEGAPAAKRQRRDWKLIDSQRSFKEEWREEFLSSHTLLTITNVFASSAGRSLLS